MKLFNSHSGSCWLGLLTSGLFTTVVPSADPPDAEGGLKRATPATAVPHAEPHRDALHADRQGTCSKKSIISSESLREYRVEWPSPTVGARLMQPASS